MSKWLGLAVLVALASGCYNASAFQCSIDKPCGPNGLCEPGFNLCSFPDDRCGPGGRSFGSLAGDQAGKCVNGQPPLDASTSIDAAIDALPDVPPDAQACFGTGLLTICLAEGPTHPLMITDLTPISTTDSPMCVAVKSGGDYCVLTGTTITIQGNVRATGTRPLVLIASDSITTTASIDVGSHRLPTEELGAGADPASCDPGSAPATANNTSGGGAGGSFIGVGGDGGNGADPTGAGNGGAGGGHGAAVAVATVTTLRGGCPGKAGAGTAPGALGHGGGAVFLIAGNKIEIHGGIKAGGEGGGAATAGASGGGGGGTGGMIGFDAPMITADSLILANGGGGGEASGSTTPGAVGADSTATTAAAGGGGNTSFGGDGGDGSTNAGAGAGAKGGNGLKGNPGGGGGGGGGAGLIKAPAGATLGNMVSPAAKP